MRSCFLTQKMECNQFLKRSNHVISEAKEFYIERNDLLEHYWVIIIVGRTFFPQPNFLYAYNSLVKKNKLHSEERNRNIVIWSYVKQTFFLYIQMLSMCLENNNLSKCPHQLVSVSHSKPRFCQCLYFYGFFGRKNIIS